MKILVTGADGQLGMSLRKVACSYPHHTFVFVGHRDCDITSRECMERWIEGVDAVVNCAAYTAVDRAETEHEAARRVNVVGAAVVAEVVARSNIVLVHVSTDYVFDGCGSRPYNESDAVSPQNIYGITKAEGEMAVMASGARAVIIRTAWLYSEFGHNFVKSMLRLAHEGKAPNVVNDQHGTPTYATGLACAIMTLLEHDVDGCKLYHYTDGGEATWYELAVEVFRLAGSTLCVTPVGSADYPTVARRPQYSVLDKSKIISAGVEVRPWRETLRECMNILLN